MATNNSNECSTITSSETSVFYTIHQNDCHQITCDTIPMITSTTTTTTTTATTTYSRNKISILQPTTLLIHKNDGNGMLPLIDIKKNDNNMIVNDKSQQSTKSLIEMSYNVKKTDIRCDFCNGTRYIILIMAVLSLTATRANEMTFNLAVICMTSNATVEG
ncbi:hypothetical protein WUBG_17266, partial [Wuchereria bancrofti]